jgi:hypothetical protein
MPVTTAMRAKAPCASASSAAATSAADMKNTEAPAAGRAATPTPRARKVLGWLKTCKLASALLWEHSCKCRSWPSFWASLESVSPGLASACAPACASGLDATGAWGAAALSLQKPRHRIC